MQKFVVPAEDGAHLQRYALDAIVNFAGGSGITQAVGLELWDLYPEALVSRAPPHGFGLINFADNPRDGHSNTPAAGVDRDNYPAGGEERRREIC